MHFKKYILLYTILPLLILTVASACYRFVVVQDYTVAYEIDCDPQTSSCFVGCEDEDPAFGECNSEYYFAEVQRYAPDLLKLCGEDITDCVEATFCQVGENECSVTFCEESSEVKCEGVDKNNNRIEYKTF